MAKILKTDQDHPKEADLEEGADVIRNGGMVVFPTETVYGLGANAFSGEACSKIFTAKNRPPDNPLIVHISSLKMLNQVAAKIPRRVLDLLDKLWPGPITILLPKSNLVPDIVTGGSDLVAVRMPDNKLALGLIERAGVPIAAPSANVSTKPSITQSRYAIEEFENKVDLIYDSGETCHGLESTIIDLSEPMPVLLRSGSMTVEELKKIFGEIKITDVARGLEESVLPRAPGMKYRHYSPTTKLYLSVNRETVDAASKQMNLKGIVAILASHEICKDSVISCIDLGPEFDFETIGRNLFPSLRRLDELPEYVGLIMPFQERDKGFTVMSRIRKAATGVVNTLEELEKLIFQ